MNGLAATSKFLRDSLGIVAVAVLLTITDLLSQDIPLEDVQYLAGHSNQ